MSAWEFDTVRGTNEDNYRSVKLSQVSFFPLLVSPSLNPSHCRSLNPKILASLHSHPLLPSLPSNLSSPPAEEPLATPLVRFPPLPPTTLSGRLQELGTDSGAGRTAGKLDTTSTGRSFEPATSDLGQFPRNDLAATSR